MILESQNSRTDTVMLTVGHYWRAERRCKTVTEASGEMGQGGWAGTNSLSAPVAVCRGLMLSS